jgi:hypothetical protein
MGLRRNMHGDRTMAHTCLHCCPSLHNMTKARTTLFSNQAPCLSESGTTIAAPPSYVKQRKTLRTNYVIRGSAKAESTDETSIRWPIPRAYVWHYATNSELPQSRLGVVRGIKSSTQVSNMKYSRLKVRQQVQLIVNSNCPVCTGQSSARAKNRLCELVALGFLGGRGAAPGAGWPHCQRAHRTIRCP